MFSLETLEKVKETVGEMRYSAETRRCSIFITPRSLRKRMERRYKCKFNPMMISTLLYRFRRTLKLEVVEKKRGANGKVECIRYTFTPFGKMDNPFITRT